MLEEIYAGLSELLAELEKSVLLVESLRITVMRYNLNEGKKGFVYGEDFCKLKALQKDMTDAIKGIKNAIRDRNSDLLS